MAARPLGQAPTNLFTCAFCEETKDEATGVIHYQECLTPKLHPLCMKCIADLSQISKDNGSCPLCGREVSEIRSLGELKAIVAKKHEIERRIDREINKVFQVFLPVALESAKAQYSKGVNDELDKALLALQDVKKAQEALGNCIIDPDQISRHQEAILAAKQFANDRKFEEAAKILTSLLPEKASGSTLYYISSAVASFATSFYGMIFAKN